MLEQKDTMKSLEKAGLISKIDPLVTHLLKIKQCNSKAYLLSDLQEIQKRLDDLIEEIKKD